MSAMLLWKVFSQVLLPILVLVACGWLLERRVRVDLTTLIKLNIYVLVPAFIFREVVSSSLGAGFAVRVMAFTVTIQLGMFLLSAVVARLSGYERRQARSLQLATMFYNSGNYGVPLMSLAFPATGPVLQVFVVLTQNICTFTVGVFLSSPESEKGWRFLLPMFRQISLWAVLCAVLVRYWEVPVHEWRWLWVPVEYLHHALVGVALVTLGVQLSRVEVNQSFGRLSWALGLRLLAGPALAAGLCHAFGFYGEEAVVLVLSAAFPTAVNIALLAHEFQADSQFAASVVFYSTLASMVTVPCLIAVLRVPEVLAFF
jgi:predicted permease